MSWCGWVGVGVDPGMGLCLCMLACTCARTHACEPRFWCQAVAHATACTSGKDEYLSQQHQMCALLLPHGHFLPPPCQPAFQSQHAHCRSISAALSSDGSHHQYHTEKPQGRADGSGGTRPAAELLHGLPPLA